MLKEPIAALTQFETINPEVKLSQADAVRRLAEAHFRAETLLSGKEYLIEETKKKLDAAFDRFAIHSSKIGYRILDTPDLLGQEWEDFALYGSQRKDMGNISDFFLARTSAVLKQFYTAQNNPPDHLLHVTCTGYASPSPAQQLVVQRGWENTTKVTHCYHMGCYGAMPSIRIAEALIARETLNQRPSNTPHNNRVDIIHTELCSLHMNPLDHSPGQIIVQTLFADGYVKYTVMPSDQTRSGLKVLHIQEQQIPDSDKDMTWIPAAWGMRMTLSKEIPEKLAFRIMPTFEKLALDSGCELAELQNEAIFAIHPGGPRIIDGIQMILELKDEQVALSREILFQRGNMSSATLPHIWKAILDQHPKSGRRVVSMAFGPGLTLFGAVFEVI